MDASDCDKRLESSLRQYREISEEFLNVALGHAYYYAEKNCDSEIEKILLIAWYLKLDQSCVFGTVRGRTARATLHPKGAGDLDDCTMPPGADRYDIVIPQYRVGQFRADIGIRRVLKAEQGNKVLTSSKVLIECDGHDYHERTKEQARHDKSRDRELQAQGFYVLRFAGSEIWRDPASCADEIDEFLNGQLGREAGVSSSL